MTSIRRPTHRRRAISIAMRSSTPTSSDATVSGSLHVSVEAVRRRFHRAAIRVPAMTSWPLGPGDALVAAERGVSDGPFASPQQLERGSVLAKWTAPVGGGVLAATATVHA